jgi:ribosomal-protein-alanine N-acetyltransferase
VHAIELESFGDPWSLKDFGEALRSGVLFLVVTEGDAILGYVIARHTAAEGEILNLAVAVPARRRGIGRVLAERALAELAQAGARAAYLEVRESNWGARHLYGRLGFREVGRRVGYYRRPSEDAVVLRAAIPAERGDAKL